jgi:hypothetical protein
LLSPIAIVKRITEVNAAADRSNRRLMVKSSRLAVALAVLMPACAAFAAEGPAARYASVAADADLALGASATRLPVQPNRVMSAGVAPSLPQELDTMIPGTQIPFYLINVGYLQRSPDAGCVSVDDPACDAPR